MVSEKSPIIEQNGKKSDSSSIETDPLKPSGSFPLDYNPKELQTVAREGILLAGGAIAILLQVANPGVGQGVNEHSNFAYRPVDRLRTTITYIYCIAFGTTDERAAIISMVHEAHSVVKGPNYNADDPDLQLWVAATLYAAATDIYEKIFDPFDDSKAEAIYQDYSVLATALRVPPGMWPKNRKEFWAYWDDKIENIEITPHAVSVANDLLWPKKAPLWIKVNMPAIRVLTTEWLPPRLRKAYGLKSTKRSRTMYKFLMAVTKGVYPHLPMMIREIPLHYYMRDMRKRLNNMV